MEQPEDNNQDPPPAELQPPVDVLPPHVDVQPPPPLNRHIGHIGAGDTPGTHTTRSGIVAPPFENNNFELRSSTIQTVENRPYNGLDLENPLAHLDLFDQYCDAFKQNGVSDDAFKLRLFPFSLAGRANKWLKQLTPGSITTWVQCKDAFLIKFYPPERTVRMRNNISNFSQRTNEDFSTALERFRTAIDDCPHHGLTQETLLSTLYRGALPNVKTFLDTASNGSFLSRDVTTGWQLVDNMTSSSSLDNRRSDHHEDNTTVNRWELQALNDKLDLLLKAKSNPTIKAINHDATHDEGAHTQFEDTHYVQQQSTHPPMQNTFTSPKGTHAPYTPQHSPGSFDNRHTFNGSNNFNAAPHTPPGFNMPQCNGQDIDIANMFQQIMQGLNASNQATTNLTNLVATNEHKMTTTFENIHARLASLEHSRASSSSVQAPIYDKSHQQPTEYTAHAITLRSGKSLGKTHLPTTITEDSDVEEGGGYHYLWY